MVNFTKIFATALLATFAVAAPQPDSNIAHGLSKRAVKSAKDVKCPVTEVDTHGKSWSKEKIEAAVENAGDPDDKVGSFPKEFRYTGTGSWPFKKATPCDSVKNAGGKIYETPIMNGVWKGKGDPGPFRVLFAIDGKDQIVCGVTAHSDKNDKSKIVACEE
ncbi:hypothetical protein BU24DRAFT_418792 [Aaosphaeria arxii CBS 175.79]|uniref:Uncharacterized protein n=1 Tax=Aaosphaeria arxii CBS 175.79 TaxID=1450172 RepID=A0A6A5Y0V7_9PLEO|nr:uncharacterized protein BU24DRAFT_418792 [Aaosphaeria arxii CBS 175.79]KAF2019185.1 hypothetical protein BU24DRAFT_418792 [Aaosphaeria arxii CBS 175.79]